VTPSLVYEAIPKQLAAALPELGPAYEKEALSYAPEPPPPTVFVEEIFIPFLLEQVRRKASATVERCLVFLDDLARSEDPATLSLLGTSVAEPLLAHPSVLSQVIGAARPRLRMILIRVRDWPRR
jgi:hypothetical protein